MFYNDDEQTEAISEIPERSAFDELADDTGQFYELSGTTSTLDFASTPTGKTRTID